MKYKKPKCECGGNLVFIEERIHEAQSNITNEGDFSKKSKVRIKDIGVSGANWLGCDECGLEYELDFDSKGKIIKGDKRS